MALFRFFIFGFYVYAFWIGTQMIRDERKNFNGKVYSAGTIFAVMIALITGMLMLL